MPAASSRTPVEDARLGFARHVQDACSALKDAVDAVVDKDVIARHLDLEAERGATWAT